MSDPLVTCELAKCQKAFNELHYKYQNLVDYLHIVLCDMPTDRACDPVFIGIENKLINIGALNEKLLPK